MNEVTVHIVVDGNGQNADITVIDTLKWGEFIPVGISKAAAEAAALAGVALTLDTGTNEPFVRDNR